ncbi:MAG TPA: ABC transporter ATP-binding protein, partial [Ktedonobacteraceae bacterium]|nr:ABC transporter ATP-binding protein [Ktedonobacteraceae bacterium]
MGFHGMGGGMAAYAEEQKKRGRKTDARTLQRVVQAFRPYKFQVVLVIIAIILTTVLGLINPLLISAIFDNAIGGHNLQLLIILVIIMFITPVVTGIIGVGQT